MAHDAHAVLHIDQHQPVRHQGFETLIRRAVYQRGGADHAVGIGLCWLRAVVAAGRAKRSEEIPDMSAGSATLVQQL